MLPEIGLIKFFINKYDIYIKYKDYIKINKDYKELYIIYNTIPKFFEAYPRDATLAEFCVFFFGYYPRLKQEEINAFHTIFMQAESMVVEDSLFTSLLEKSLLRGKALEIAKRAIAFTEGRSSCEEFGESISEWGYDSEKIAPETQFVTSDLEELYVSTHSTSGLRWRLPSLNKALGSLRKGDFGFVFARPETGKTTFLASEVSWMAGQVSTPILWVNNEEQGSKVKLRCFQAALGLTLVELFGDRRKNQETYDNLTGRRIQIYDSGATFRSEVERVISDVKPSLIIFDQIDKIRGFSGDRNDLVMGSIYQWARELAKEYAPVVGVCQADGTAEGVKWLTMSNVAEAKTSKQSEADWILGIGKSHDEQLRNVRHFHLSKNKLMGDTDSDPEWRHARWDVYIDTNTARYRDL